MGEVESFEHAGKTVTIYWDEDPMSPIDSRYNEQNWALVCWHRRSNLGHDNRKESVTADELKAEVEESGDKIRTILPLYLYEHSGMTLSTKPYGCRWDSGQVGWIYMTVSQFTSMGFEDGYLLAHDTAGLLESVVKNYDDFLAGRCYGYVVTNSEDDELESCWGFIGDLDDVRSEGKCAAEYATDPMVERMANELMIRATYAGV